MHLSSRRRFLGSSARGAAGVLLGGALSAANMALWPADQPAEPEPDLVAFDSEKEFRRLNAAPFDSEKEFKRLTSRRKP